MVMWPVLPYSNAFVSPVGTYVRDRLGDRECARAIASSHVERLLGVSVYRTTAMRDNDLTNIMAFSFNNVGRDVLCEDCLSQATSHKILKVQQNPSRSFFLRVLKSGTRPTGTP